MNNGLMLFSKRFILVVSLACCQVVIASVAAVAAQGPEGIDENSIDSALKPAQKMAIKARDQERGSALVNPVGSRKGEIFRGLSPAGVEAAEPSWPGAGLFSRSRDESPAMGTAVPGDNTGAAGPNGNQGPSNEKPSTVTSTIPMTAGEKFGLFATDSFKPPMPYALSILSGVWDEATDYKHKKPHRTAGDFAADSLTHAARSYAFRVTSNFFEKFAYPTLFKQDPRYHRSPYTAFWPRVKYAVTRVLITQGDRNGKNEFNISFLAGGLTTAGISNLWEPAYHQNVQDTMSRWGTHIGLRALMNILSEFIGGQ